MNVFLKEKYNYIKPWINGFLHYYRTDMEQVQGFLGSRFNKRSLKEEGFGFIRAKNRGWRWLFCQSRFRTGIQNPKSHSEIYSYKVPYIFLINQEMTWDCLLFSVLLQEFTWSEPKIVLNIKTEQFYVQIR